MALLGMGSFLAAGLVLSSGLVEGEREAARIWSNAMDGLGILGVLVMAVTLVGVLVPVGPPHSRSTDRRGTRRDQSGISVWLMRG